MRPYALTYQRRPGLDLTRSAFSPAWWARALFLLALLAAATLSLSVTPTTRTDIPFTAPSKSDVDAPESDAASQATDLSAAYDDVQAMVREHSQPTSYALTKTITLGKGETLSDALMRSGIPAGETFAALARLDDVYNVRRARPGLEMKVETHPATLQSLERLTLKSDYRTLATVTRSANATFAAELIGLETLERQQVVHADIPNSLYLAAEGANMPASTIISLIRALSFRVDFQREIRAGDSFKAVYTRAQAADGSSQAGDVLYAELDLGDRVERLYRFTHPKTGRTDYFDHNGESMRRLLMRTPIDGARLTSGFGKRRHPVLGYVKSHQGVDFGAPTGTPIYAAGDGVIERANRFGSYGNYVRIAHARGYKTAYAHLSRFAKGMKPGKRVRQGQVIGYVGATGRVTGAHLHYEVLKGNRRVNPMRLDLPTGEVLDGEALTAFKAHKAKLDATLGARLAATALSTDALAPAAGG